MVKGGWLRINQSEKKGRKRRLGQEYRQDVFSHWQELGKLKVCKSDAKVGFLLMDQKVILTSLLRYVLCCSTCLMFGCV